MAPPTSGLANPRQPPRPPPLGGRCVRTGPQGFTIRHGVCVIRAHTALEAAHLVSLLGLRLDANAGRLPGVDCYTQTDTFSSNAEGAPFEDGPPTSAKDAEGTSAEYGPPTSTQRVEQSKTGRARGWAMVDGRWSKQSPAAILDSSACSVLGLLTEKPPVVEGLAPALGHYTPPPSPKDMKCKRSLQVGIPPSLFGTPPSLVGTPPVQDGRLGVGSELVAAVGSRSVVGPPLVQGGRLGVEWVPSGWGLRPCFPSR